MATKERPIDRNPPIVSQELLEYLEDVFNVDHIIYKANQVEASGDERFGLLQGVRGVITHLKAIHEEQNEERLEDYV